MLQMKYDQRLSAMEEYAKKLKCLRPMTEESGGPITPCRKNPIFITTDLKEKGEITYQEAPVKGKKPKGESTKPKENAPVHFMPVENVLDILNNISIKDLFLMGFGTYHRNLPEEAVLSILDEANPSQLQTLLISGDLKGHSAAMSPSGPEALKAELTPRQINYKIILEHLGALPEEALENLGLSIETYKKKPSSVILKILDELPPESLKEYGFIFPNTHRNLRFNLLLGILDLVSENTLKELGFLPGNHPRNKILKAVLVPPVSARPPIYQKGILSHDHLTEHFKDIFNMVKVLESNTGKAGRSRSDLYRLLRQLMFKTDSKNIAGSPFLAIIPRIQGKDSLMRGLLMGKRGDYNGRTVVGPASPLRFGQIRTPRVWTQTHIKKTKITDFNREVMEKLVQTGRVTHLIPRASGYRKYYRDKNKIFLEIGDKIERPFMTGDRVADNRQPTLHSQSMMAYHAVLGDENTIGLHLSYTTPMNCDFDGDENNVWIPQDNEVEAELEILSNVINSMPSAEQNRLIMGLVMNSNTGAFLLSDPRTRLEDDLFAELLSLITNQEEVEGLYQRLAKYGVHPRSGAALFSALLPADFFYFQKGLLIIEGVLLSGKIKKAHVGPTTRSLEQDIYKRHGPYRTADFFTDAPYVINKWLVERGFSVGMLDILNLGYDEKKEEEYDKNEKILSEELAKIYIQMEALGGKVEDVVEEKLRRKQINNLVNRAQEIGLRLAKEVLSGDNAIGVMTDQGAGTKGGLANIGQMMGSVGQQNYRGDRLRATLTKGRRILPTFDEDDNHPIAHGFVPTSYATGLSPESLFYIQAGGRENLLDTALRTSETGDMQRRMMKAFENVVIGYDGSVRNTVGTMFSPIYNAGYDIGEMVSINTPGKQNFSSFIDIKSLAYELNIERGWVPEDVNELVKRNLAANSEALEQEELLARPPVMKKTPEVTDTAINYDITQPVPLAEPHLKLTKYEKARIIGTRANQLANNARPLVEVTDNLPDLTLPPEIDQESASPEEKEEHQRLMKYYYDDLSEAVMMLDPVTIAIQEYENGLLTKENGVDLGIVRKFADGTYVVVKPTRENV
jgi:DNA-directed RNA polymerase beta' subunit/DNA-directed RNA polymerase subunit K/omega